MKKVGFLTLTVAAMAMMLSGCQKETLVNDGGGGTDGEGKAARMSLRFTVPTSPTRAVQDGANQAALAAESTISTVDVYIFKSSGVKATTGAHTRLALADFTEAPAGTFTLNTDKQIETLSGDNARVYVGANLGNNFNAEFADEAYLLAVPADVDASLLNDPGGAGSIYNANNFTMFGNAVAVVNLKPYVAGDAATVTTASIQLERVAAKVVVTATGPQIVNSSTDTWDGINVSYSGQYKVSWDVPASGYEVVGYDEVELTYSFWGYRPVQNARQSYIAPNFLSEAEASDLPFFAEGQNYAGKHKTYAPYNGTPSPLRTLSDNTTRYETAQFAEFGAPNAQRYVYTGTSAVTDVNTLAPYWYYIGENRDYITPSANGRTTYVMVSTVVNVNRQASYDVGPDGQFHTVDDVGIHYTAVEDGSLGGGDDEILYIVKNMKTGRVYITANYDDDGDNIPDGQLIAQRIAYDSGWDGTPATLDQYAKIFGYPYGFVHFPIYLDGYAGTHVADRYGIFRNQFLHVNITGIFGEPGAFPGYPGDEDGDPSVDPTNPTDPNNPYPKPPTNPVDGSPSMLQVEFQIQPWYYLIKDGVILQ